MFFLLIATYLALFVLSFRRFDRDIFSPPTALSALFALSAIISTYNMDKWDMWSFHANTYGLFTWGLAVFIGVSYVVQKLVFKTDAHSVPRPAGPSGRAALNPNQVTLWLVILMDVAILALFYREVFRIAVEKGGYAGGGYAALMTAYKDASSYKGVLSLEEGIPVYLNQLIKLMTVFGYVYMYFFINNAVVHRLKKRDWLLLLPIFLYILQKLLNAGRIELLGVAAAAVMMWYMLWRRAYGWRRGVNLKLVAVCGGSFIAVILAFYLLRNVVGRNSSRDFLSYIANYAGSSTRLFDLYLQDPTPPGAWGQETFYSIHRFLAKYGISGGEMFSKHLEYRYVGDVNVGNVYSAFRRYYHDFGFLGLTVLQAVSALIYNTFYVAVKYRKLRPDGRIADFSLLMYSFIVYALFIIPIDDHIYSTELSVSTFTSYVLLYAAYWAALNLDWRTCFDGVLRRAKRIGGRIGRGS